MEATIAEARNIGYSSMRGDTVPSTKITWVLYTSLGYKEIDPYCHKQPH